MVIVEGHHPHCWSCGTKGKMACSGKNPAPKQAPQPASPKEAVQDGPQWPTEGPSGWIAIVWRAMKVATLRYHYDVLPKKAVSSKKAVKTSAAAAKTEAATKRIAATTKTADAKIQTTTTGSSATGLAEGATGESGTSVPKSTEV